MWLENPSDGNFALPLPIPQSTTDISQYNVFSLMHGELDLSSRVMWRGKPDTLYKLRVIPLESGLEEVTAHVYVGVRKPGGSVPPCICRAWGPWHVHIVSTYKVS